jgi:hypothetical protein
MPSKSESQQKLFGMALSYKRGELKNVSKKVKELGDSMSEKELVKFSKKVVKTESMKLKDILLRDIDIKTLLKEDNENVYRVTLKYISIFFKNEIKSLDYDSSNQEATIYFKIFNNYKAEGIFGVNIVITKIDLSFRLEVIDLNKDSSEFFEIEKTITENIKINDYFSDSIKLSELNISPVDVNIDYNPNSGEIVSAEVEFGV